MEKLNKILLLTDCFNDTAAGAEKQIFELARGLRDSKYSVKIVSLDSCDPSIFPLVESVGAELRVFRVKRIYGLSGLTQGIRFFQFLRQEKIDIVQTYHFGSDIWGTLIARMAGIKVIISNRRDMGFWRKDIHVRAYRWVNRWVKKIVVNAKSIKDMIVASEGVPAQNIEVIYNGVEFDRQAEAGVSRSSLGLNPDDIVLMHVANLKAVKGHIYLFEALRIVLEEHRNVKLLLIGDDMFNGSLQQKAQTLGTKDHVSFLGKRRDVSALLPIADICVLPSLSEGLSNAILEYMIAAKPVVATAVGGNSELVEEGVTGLLVPKENGPALAQALLKLIADKDLRVSMGAQGRQKALANFSVKGMAKHYEDLFDSILPRKIKVLHFISSGGFFGAENVLLNIAQNFNNDNYISCVAAIRDGRRPHLEVIDRARTLGLPVHVFESRGLIDWQTIKALKKFLLDHKIDILHTHNYKSDIIGALAARGTRVSLVSTAHGFTGMNSKVSWYERLDQWVLKNQFKRTVVVTAQMMPDFPTDKKRVIKNGIDFKKFEGTPSMRAEIRGRYQIHDQDIVVGTVGRLSVEKDQALLLSALKELCRAKPQVKLMIVGDGPEAETLRHFVKENGLEGQIIFTGLIPNPVPFYQAFDIFVLSSRTEGVPLTVLEAMASRVPVVATKVGGIPKIITDGVTGLLVDPQNAAQLRDAIDTLILDHNKRQAFKEAAFHFAKENYSIDRMNWLYHEVYQEVLSP
jgi:glycosyltransferase involved in cell wall biosynthesis